jgi:hypothetical protein
MINKRMKTKIIFLYILVSLFWMPVFSQNIPLIESVQELKARGGLPNFFSKIAKGDSIKVAYLGGSITAQDGWRVYSLDWMKQRFPKAGFSEINATIGGTGSDFGVFRLRDQVLKFKPDLVFVEFAENDAHTAPQKIIRSMEGIVRQTWQYDPFIDICFIYTIDEGLFENEQKGVLPASVSTMEKVAEKYNIPAINFGPEVCKMVNNHQLIFKGGTKAIDGIQVFSGDGVHPYPETGHVIYNNVLKRSMETMTSGKQEQAERKNLPSPLAPDYFSNTHMIDFSEAKLSKNWTVINVQDNPSFAVFGKYLKSFGKAGQTGETLTVRFKGKTIGAYDLMGPDAGKVIVEVDGNIKDTISRFDAYCTYRRMAFFMIDHLDDKVHEVVFKVLSEPFDKAGILRKRGNVIKNPEDYRENNWYVGKILMDGVLM